jgi:hypothetical protein
MSVRRRQKASWGRRQPLEAAAAARRLVEGAHLDVGICVKEPHERQTPCQKRPNSGTKKTYLYYHTCVKEPHETGAKWSNVV